VSRMAISVARIGVDMKYEKHDFDMAIQDYADHLVGNYQRWAQSADAVGKYEVSFYKGRKFLKVVKTSWGSRGVHSFICIQEHDQWKYGDILKAASWAQPAKNFARGNVLNTDSYKYMSWTGA
jgi:hypothetical protein